MAAPMSGNEASRGCSEFKAEKYPKEIASNLRVFKESLTEVENALAPLRNASMGDVHSKLEALDRAKLELVSAYAINSMFWMYLCTQGVNPREHPIKHELGRIQKYMNRVKEIVDKEHAAKLDKGAAKRFVKAALYDANEAPKLDKAVAKRFFKAAQYDASEGEDKQKGKRKARDDAQSGPSKKR